MYFFLFLYDVEHFSEEFLVYGLKDNYGFTDNYGLVEFNYKVVQMKLLSRMLDNFVQDITKV